MTEVRLLTASGPVSAIRVLHPGDGRYAGALSTLETSRVLQDLRRSASRKTLLSLYELAAGSAPGTTSSSNDARLVTTIEAAVKQGRIVFTRGSSLASGGPAAVSADRGGKPTSARQIMTVIMAGRSTIPFEGRQYCLCEVGRLVNLPDRDQFQVVRIDEARDLLARLAARPGTPPGDAEVYPAAAELLRDRVPLGAEAGLFLLRQVQRTYREAPIEPELPPSRPKPAPAPKLDITITFLAARSRRPLKDMPFKVTKPDGSVVQMKTTAAGVITLSGLDPGKCDLTSIIQGATLATSFAEGEGIAPGASGSDQDSNEADADADDADDASMSEGDAGGVAAPDAGGEGTVAGGASGSADASGSLGLGVSVSVDALAHGDIAGAVKITGTSTAQASATASLSAGATAGLSGAAPGSGSVPPAASPTAGLAGSDSGPGGPAAAAPDSSPISPAFLVMPETHHVATGETTDSIASQAGLSWDDIAIFNFETSDPDTVQEMLGDRVGCTQTTPDGESYRLDDDDDPGVISLPRPWTASFVVGQEYEVIAAPMRAIYISLQNEDGIALPGARYEVSFVDGSRRSGTLGSAGIARVDGVPEGPFAVSYPDPQDLLARSLAASTRRAFDEQATGPLFYLLGQEQEVIDSAVAIYEAFFNDLTGDGFAADIDQVVTDPDARVPLLFLCAMAGIDVEGASGATIQEDESREEG